MRTINDILETYINFGKPESEHVTLNGYLSSLTEDERQIEKARLYKEILNHCLDKKHGIFYFFTFILGDLMYAGYPKPIRFNSLFLKFEKLVKNHKHLAIQCARSHGKSTFSYIYMLYIASIFKNQLIILESASDKQAVKHFKKIRRIIDNNEFLLEKIPPNAQDTKNHLDFNGGYIEAYGFGSEIRGDHVDLIIVDDILRSDNKLSHQDIENFMFEELEPMIGDRKGQIMLIGTRKDENDIFGTVSKNPAWKSVNFPAIIDFKRRILQCPDRFTWEDLMLKLAVQGKRSFMKEYQNEFYTGSASVFDIEDIRKAKEKGKDLVLLKKGDPKAHYVAGVDTARAGSASADYSVMIVLEIDYSNYTKKIVHIWRTKGLKTKNQVEKIAEISRKFNNCTVLVEKNNMGQEFIDQLIDDYNVDVETFTTTATGAGSKENLIRLLVNSFENEKIILPYGNEETRNKIDILVDELAKFQVVTTRAGNETMKGVGAHDDTVMALALAIKAAQITGGAPVAIVEQDKTRSKSLSDLELLIKYNLI